MQPSRPSIGLRDSNETASRKPGALQAPASILSRDRATLDRPGADDQVLIIGYSMRIRSEQRRGASEPCLSLVPPTGARWRRARPLDELPRPFARQRSAAPVVRDYDRAAHGRGSGRRRGLRRPCQPDLGSNEPAARRRVPSSSRMKPPATPCASIWGCSTMRRLAARRRSRRSRAVQ